MKSKNNNRHGGFSLIELMISMVLGLFIVAGVGAVYISSKQTYETRNLLSEMDESARVAIRVLREHIEHAGYASMTGVPVDNYLLPSGFAPSAAACPTGVQSIINTANIYSSQDGSGLNGSDSVGVAFIADQQLNTDCTNSSWINRCLPAGSTDAELANRQARLVYNSFSVAASSGVPALMCGGSLNSTRQPVAQGIENLQIRYGVDVLPNPIPAGQKKQWEVDNYWTATQVTANNAWDKVAVVQVALLVRTVGEAFPDSQPASYQLFDTTVNTNDRFKRAVYTTTVHLRNIAR